MKKIKKYVLMYTFGIDLTMQMTKWLGAGNSRDIEVHGLPAVTALLR